MWVMEGAVLECADVKKSFPGGREVRRILDGVSLKVAAGEWVAVTGPSGVGKTTLLHVMAGILPPDSGQVFWDGGDLSTIEESERDFRRAHSIGLVFQFHNLLPDLTVEENIGLSMRLARQSGQDFDGRVGELLTHLGLKEFADARIDKLSGGERQRVAVARALAHRPKLVLADEPTGNLDGRSADAVLDLFQTAIRETGVAIVLSTHNPAVAARANRQLDLRGGQFQI